jgi:hypothetical protein
MADPTAVAAEAAKAAEPVALAGLPHITFTDLAVISLTAVGVIVAAMAVMIGIAAIIGWQALKRSAAKQAMGVAQKAVDAHLVSPEFHVKLGMAVELEVAEQIKSSITIALRKPRSGGRRDGSSGDKAPFGG